MIAACNVPRFTPVWANENLSGRPFIKRFALCYWSIVCLSCLSVSVTMVYCGQMVGWIKMKLVMEVGCSPGHIASDRDPAPPPPKGHSPSIFGPCLLWPNGWMDQDATWYEGRPWPRPHCVRWGPSSHQKGGTDPNFRHVSIMTKWSPISATSDHLVDNWRKFSDWIPFLSFG